MGTAIVIGAGIGGLTAALALGARGFTVDVYERAPALLDVGAAIVLAQNALRALDTLPGGVAHELRALAPDLGEGGMRSIRGRWLIHQDLAGIRARLGQPMVPVLRPDLIRILASRMPRGSLHLGAEVAAVDADAGAVTLVSGERVTADLIVAADGIHSPTRRALFPDFPQPVFAGARAWLLTARDPGGDVVPGEIWADGLMFGMMPMTGGRLFAFGEERTPSPAPVRDPAAEYARMRELFARFPAPVPAIIASVDPTSVITTDLHTLAGPAPAFHRDRVALLGDAAHAMTPNMGQGGCQAIEDALTLASVAPDLARYTASRRSRTRMLLAGSRMMTRIATASGGAARLRDGGLHTLDVIARPLLARPAAALLAWDPPAPVDLPQPEDSRPAPEAGTRRRRLVP